MSIIRDCLLSLFGVSGWLTTAFTQCHTTAVRSPIEKNKCSNSLRSQYGYNAPGHSNINASQLNSLWGRHTVSLFDENKVDVGGVSNVLDIYDVLMICEMMLLCAQIAFSWYQIWVYFTITNKVRRGYAPACPLCVSEKMNRCISAWNALLNQSEETSHEW